MSENNFFRNKEEELQHLAQEIAELKLAMKEMSASLSRIERHVKRSFGVPDSSKSAVKSKQTQSNRFRKKEEATISPEEALLLFDELSENWAKTETSFVEEKLHKMSIPNLKLMAHELGLTFKSKPSKKTLSDGIKGRLNERSMLSRNINITSPRKDNESENQ